MRRLYHAAFGNGYVTRQLELRQGECQRCGACCKLLFRCPFLNDTVSPPTCRIYGRTSPTCRLFPLDRRDLADRDLVMPHRPCGFHFGNGDSGTSGSNGHDRPE